MGKSEINCLTERLREIERAHARLFASIIEFRIQLSILRDEHEELYCRNQQLRAIGAFVTPPKHETDSIQRTRDTM